MPDRDRWRDEDEEDEDEDEDEDEEDEDANECSEPISRLLQSCSESAKDSIADMSDGCCSRRSRSLGWKKSRSAAPVGVL